MSDKTPAKKQNAGGLSNREMEVLGLAWQCFKSTPEVDMEKLASLAGYENKRSASNCLSAAKKKLLVMGSASTPVASGSGGGDGSATPTPTKQATKRKAKASDAASAKKQKIQPKNESSDDDDDDEYAEPLVAATKKVASVAKDEPEEDAEELDEV